MKTEPISSFLYLVLFLVLTYAQAALAVDYTVSPTVQGSVAQWKPFKAKEFNATKTVRVYLPPSYGSSSKRYPVLYLMDGQNVFDHKFAAKGGWLIDKTLNQLASVSDSYELIVVALDHSTDRAAEYVPYKLNHPHFQTEASKSDLLGKFIVEELKPAVDTKYRTLTDRESTFIGGASFGSFFSIYTALNYDHVFSKVWAYSTALATHPVRNQFAEFVRSHQVEHAIDWYFYVGKDEYTGDSLNVARYLGEIGMDNVVHFIDANGGHDEPSWAVASRNAIPWLFGVSATGKYDWTAISRTDGQKPIKVTGVDLGTKYDAGVITFEYSGEASNVQLAGTFNYWNANAADYALSEIETNRWVLELPMSRGTYEYKFVVDQRWVEVADDVTNMLPVPTDVIPNGLGGSNALLVLE